MGIYKKGFCAVISILLCSILITSTAISGTFAKFTVNDSSDDSARVSKWGIELSSSTGLTDTYADGDVIYVTSEGTIGGEIIAPGTKGVLAELTVSGKPEVAYRINVDGTFLTGDAYHTQPHAGATEEELKKCPNVCPGLLRMPDGTKLGYLPMIFKLYKTVDETKTLVSIYRVGNTSSGDKDYVNGSGVAMAKQISSDISSKFDETKNPNFDVNITYTLEWEWLYTPTGNTPIEYEDFTNFTHTHQTSEKDTALGVSLHKHKDILNLAENDSRRCQITGLAPFDITASITLEVSQVD